MRSILFVLTALFALPSYAYRTSAWVPSWDPNAVTAMERRAGALDETNPGWYTIGANGSVVKNAGAEDPRLLAAMTGTEITPTIKNYVDGRFDGDLVARIVGSAASREQHAEAITQLAVQKAYAGIDIDYERVPLAARGDFSAFVRLLAAKLHSADKRLSVTVHAKTSDAATWSGPGGQDWTAIGAAADSVKIMAYDYHWSTSAAGPIAPLKWLDAIATYAETTIPRQKIVMALPWYGYDWRGTSGRSVTYADAMANARAAAAPIVHDANGEATYTYGDRTVYFQDAASYRRKIEYLLERHPHIGGFAHWRVGAEDPAIWEVVESVRKDFALSGPSELRTVAGSPVTAEFSIEAISGWSEPVTLSAAMIDPFDGSVSTSGMNLSVSTSERVMSGTYRIAVTASSGSIVREQIVTLQVTSRRKRRAV